MAGTVIADRLEAASTSQLVIENGVALTPPTIVDVNNVQIGTFCRAWVNFNGTGTVAIRASFNVTSITDNGTGDYTVNFTNALTDANYAAVITNVGLAASDTRRNSVIAGVEGTGATTMSTTAIRINVGNPASASLSDNAVMNVSVFR